MMTLGIFAMAYTFIAGTVALFVGARGTLRSPKEEV